MFSKSITNSAKFLRMPQTSRLLYYDLGMAADDDGIVEAFTVLRTTGAAEDDLRVLAARGFLLVLNEELVSYIKDWKENNQIRKDRYKPSVYAELLVKILDGSQMATIGLPDGNQMETQVSIGKDRIGKDRIGQDGKFTPPTVSEVEQYCHTEGISIDAGKFVDYYASKGWMVGNTPMSNWKSAIRYWAKTERQHTRKAVPQGASGNLGEAELEAIRRVLQDDGL